MTEDHTNDVDTTIEVNSGRSGGRGGNNNRRNGGRTRGRNQSSRSRETKNTTTSSSDTGSNNQGNFTGSGRGSLGRGRARGIGRSTGRNNDENNSGRGGGQNVTAHRNSDVDESSLLMTENHSNSSNGRHSSRGNGRGHRSGPGRGRHNVSRGGGIDDTVDGNSGRGRHHPSTSGRSNGRGRGGRDSNNNTAMSRNDNVVSNNSQVQPSASMSPVDNSKPYTDEPRIHTGDKKESSDTKTGNKKNLTKGGGSSNRVGNTGSTGLASTVSANTTYAPTVPPNQPQQTSNIQYGKGETVTILHVAEKPSIAQAIAKGLIDSDQGSSGGGGGRNKPLPVHEFTTTSKNPFPKAPYATKFVHKVTSVVGHVFSVDFPKQYQSWESVDPAELFDAPVLRTPNKGSVVKHLQDEARNVHFIVLWMDCDREGENINFEVLDCCMHLMKSGGNESNYDRVYRAYFSAINPSDIRKAYAALGKPDKNQALAVDARQELDLKIGVSFSRFQTRFFQGRYGDLDSAVLSYGPCQTPTLGFCVQRHIDIETFKPEPYWVLELNIMKRGRNLKGIWTSGRSFNKNRVEQLLKQALENDPFVQVRNVVIKDKKQGRPVPLNTVALLKACSKALGIGPHAAMQTAERLYLSGYLSYPRTESTTYPKSFDIVGTLRQQLEDNRWGTYVRELLQSEHNPSPRGGVDMGDHPPITPCRPARSNELSGDMARVFELVVRHFIASVSPDAVWRSTRVTFGIASLEDKGEFILSGKEPVSPGFLSVLLHKEYGNETPNREGLIDEYDHDEEEISIPEFTKDEVIPVLNTKSQSSSKVNVVRSESAWSNIDIKEKITTPPTHLTEAELIGMMEKHGIGTDASIATHIENVQKRNYVAIATGRRLIPSKLGLVLVQGYHQIDSSLVLPQVRSDIESQCNKIALGQASKDVVVHAAINLFRNKYDVFVKCIDKMDVLFSSSFLKLEDVGKPFTRCGFTRRYLTYIPGTPPRLYNKWTETVYPLPAGGTVKQWTGKHCPVNDCNFELCLYSVGQPERTFPLCPRCFNDINFALDQENVSSDPIDRADQGKEREIRKMGGKLLVLECPLPDCHPSIDELTVSPHPDSDGVLILDPHFGPKWRFVSTRDATTIHLPQSITKVTVLDRKDPVLQCHLIQVEFKEGDTPLPDGKLKHTCCFANDELLQGMVRIHHGSDRLKPTGRGGRGRGGRGRGRGGDGRSGRGRR